MRKYEIMIIVDPEIDERSITASLERYINVIKAGGTVDNVDVWGRRRLAYDIKKHSEGVYVVIDFTSESAVAQELDRQLGLSESILRTKLLRRDAA
ncbi:30S ribosomal protein S6 [Dermatophilus congolensis]|uniref:Small ribosomal subunit protein bS6 n=1 Tax=Dermatophilus congolensis TaxID=1863 RepID=A0A239V8C9_9MICO|nr:30S ribosomal protein S6 [Dermatophilus congolensis]MBO3130499.1 30S ribosomal protein S6 [Dermatophilus congolensis]MBO3130871.1 30S ribosomal protein S6 [Dermatophilus congolensis]MBO3134971.1 30S ribosomal protein S6 [Dermatophilus congolensis]MBO3137210.1 30S ribosomal protein S6 [Dermatophilus congolensis]MBO3139453.1 30S ribosomal protein S6 [Dermatophilus congolensis]